MAFMVPQYEKGGFCRIERNGETIYTGPAEYAPDREDGDEVSQYDEGVFARLSAPGYMDCTEWDGPFTTLAEAKTHIQNTFDVDPLTGDDLPEDGGSGYTDCACRDCFNVVVSNNVNDPDLCYGCAHAGCEKNDGECQRMDAYGMDAEEGEV